MAKEAIPFDMYATGAVDLQAAASKKVGGGRYSLRRILGRGGMGIVWLAQDERLNREVALKFLPPQIRYDAGALDDLKRETARSQGLSHPNIIRIHDFYEAEGEDPFISMEYVDGSTLSNIRVQQSERVLSWDFLEPLVRQLCDALEYAHGEGIVHRDLKPANLMVDQTGRLKLADFGIARAVTDTMSRSSIAQTSGTLLYMSPQQMEGGTPKRTDDVYGLGACLYELLTSKPPFHTGDLLHQVRNQVPKPLGERLVEFGLKNNIPSYVNDLVLTCLQKDERKRPRTAHEVAEWIAMRSDPRAVEDEARKRDWRRFAATTQWSKALRWCAVAASIALGVFAAWLIRPGGTVAARPGTNSTATTLSMSTTPGFGSTQKIVMAGRHNPPPQQVKPTPLSGIEPTNTQSTIITGSVVAAAQSMTRVPLNPPLVSPPTLLSLIPKANAMVEERSRNKLLRAISSRSPIATAPQRWRLVYSDAEAAHGAVELRFDKGLMAQAHEPTRVLEIFNPQANKPIDMERIKTDSDEAVTIALALPGVIPLGVDSLELELERGAGSIAVWKVRLFTVQNNTEKAVGTVIIAAEDGRVLRDISKR